MMPDLENVIRGLECCMATDDDISCTDCPYNDPTTFEYGENGCLREKLMPDAIKLLKEQEAVKPKYKERMGGFVAGLCPTCGTALNNILNVKACGKCGQKVKWE